MSSLPKTTFQNWTKNWEGRKQWAQDNSIPFSDFKQAVQYDYNRMTNPNGFGKPMGDDEAFDALSSLKNGHDPFSTPGDTPPTILDNPTAAIHDNLQSIFTGLFHAPQQIAHDFNSALHGHPGEIANLIPGYTDITSLFSSKGRDYLLQNPISDILDVGGIGKIADVAEQGARAAGATGVADTLKAIPNHPISTAAKATALKMTTDVATLGKLKEGVLGVAQSAGLTRDVQEQILRPSRAIKDAMNHVPAPGLLDNIRNFKPKFGWTNPGLTVHEFQHQLAEGLTQQDMDDINDVATKSNFRGTPMTIREYLDNPQFTDLQKTAMRGLAKSSTNLRLAEWINEKQIKPVYHRDGSGQQGWVNTEGSSWEAYTNRLDRTKEAYQKQNAALSSGLNDIYSSIQSLRQEDAGLPQALNWDPEIPTPVPQALVRTADFFRINKDQLFKLMPDNIKKDVFERRLNKTFGKGSRIETLTHELSSLRNIGDANKIFDLIKGIRRELNTLKLPDSQVKQWLDNVLGTIRTDTTKIYNTQLKLSKLKESADTAKRRYQNQDDRYQLNWNKFTQARFQPIVQDKMKEMVHDYIWSHYGTGEIHLPKRLQGQAITPMQVEKIMQDVEMNYYSSEDMQTLIPRSDWIQMQNDAYSFIDEARMNGADPIFVTAISPTEAGSIEKGFTSADLSHYVRRSVEKERKPIISDSIYNVWLGIPKEAMGIWKSHLVSHFLNEFIIPRTMSDENLATRSYSEFSSTYDMTKAPNDLPMIAQEWARQNNYVAWDPNDPLGLTSSRFSSGTAHADRLWIHSNDLKIIRGTFHEMDQQVNKVYNAMMQGYRVGVLYASPRYAAHIMVGGSVMALLQMEHPIIDTAKYLQQAIHFGQNPHLLPAFMSKGPAEQGIHGELVENPFGASNFLSGRTAGRLAAESAAKRLGLDKVQAGLQVYKNFLETVNLTQRSLVYLSGKARVSAEDITPEIRQEARKWNMKPSDLIGARMANKALADMMIISPMERAVLMRYVMPFWGWTRHILRYVSTFPMDHPLRSSIINTLSEQAIGEGSNLPDYLFRLLFLGQPNAQGNVTVLDTRQWNPFRDVANYMTWGGIMSGLNPVLSSIASSAWGVDPATGGPDLYPELTYDSFYGSSTATTGNNYFSSLLQQISPQISTLTQVMQKTSVLRSEAYANPSKLPYLIADSVGIPWIPYTLNIPQLKIKESTKEYGLASAAVQQSLIKNSLDPLKGYSGYLPYSGYEVNKGELSDLINQALSANKASGLNIPASDQISLPYSSPYAPEYLISGAPPAASEEQSPHAQGGLSQ